MQGFNMGRYVPPEHEGLVSGNKLHKKKPPGFHGSTQTVRFEMPFNIFCLQCSGHIAQGVRFNAEKKRVGSYFTTPIFSFRMRHTDCSNWIEIRTDPKNTAYIVTEGATKKAADEVGEGEIIVKGILEDKERLENPFAALEKTVQDKSEAKQGAERIQQLQELSERQWLDPYTHSRKMRKIFREKRKTLLAEHTESEAIRTRLALSIPLLPSSPSDAVQAKMVEFGSADSSQDLDLAHSKPLFPLDEIAKKEHVNTRGKTKAQIAAEISREKLTSELRRNTRARVDPFLNLGLGNGGAKVGRLLKRKQEERDGKEVEMEAQGTKSTEGVEKEEEEKAEVQEEMVTETIAGKVTPGISLGLEGYDSD